MDVSKFAVYLQTTGGGLNNSQYTMDWRKNEIEQTKKSINRRAIVFHYLRACLQPKEGLSFWHADCSGEIARGPRSQLRDNLSSMAALRALSGSIRREPENTRSTSPRGVVPRWFIKNVAVCSIYRGTSRRSVSRVPNGWEETLSTKKLMTSFHCVWCVTSCAIARGNWGKWKNMSRI